MALAKYRIEAFSGLDQSMCENGLSPADSPDACNMDTFGGILTVAKGYVRHSEVPLPANAVPLRLWPVVKSGETSFLAACANGLYLLSHDATAWTQLAGFNTARTKPNQFDFLRLKIASTEYLLIANGLEQMHKWDGTSAAAAAFGSAAALSDMPASMIELYFSRLFVSGDPAHPCRLYWSCAPGDERTVESFAEVPTSENVGGGFVEIGTDSEPITALVSLSNQLVIFKRDSLYRLLGDRPSNFRVTPVNAAMDSCVHTALVRCGDVIYFLTKSGLYYYDGQTAKRAPDADRAKNFLAGANLDRCTAAAAGGKLYFAVREGTGAQNDAVLVYDTARGTYMVRRGFTAADMAAVGDALYLIDGSGYVCRFNEGTSYAGAQIAAYWYTPETDLGDKCAVKRLRELYLRGSGGLISVSAETQAGTVFRETLMPRAARDILELPLSGEGRAFRLKLENVLGSHFAIEGGVELLLDAQRRVL